MVLLHSSMVPLGTPAPDFCLKGIDDRMHALEDYNEADFLVVVFMCNHCPYVQAIWDDLVLLEKKMPKPKVQFIGINANSNPNYPEDSFEKMKDYAAERKQAFPYLYDEDQDVAKAYSAQCTPDIFLYGKERHLLYRGAFDALEKSLEKLLNGEALSQNQAHSMGCSIKWMEQT